MGNIFDTFFKGGNVSLFDSFKEHWLFLLTWVLGIIVLAFAVFFIVRAVKKKRTVAAAAQEAAQDADPVAVSDAAQEAAPDNKGKCKKPFFETKTLVIGALCLGLAFILSYIRLWEMPQGGSITLASSLPIILFAYVYGWKHGLIVAFTFSLLQMIQSPAYVMSLPQALLDYVVAFTVLGIAGFFRKSLYPGVLLAYGLRFAAHVAAGLLFYLEYNTTSFSGLPYSLLYNGAYLLPELVICLVVISIPAVKRMFERFKVTALT